jgi:hypothetical protein
MKLYWHPAMQVMYKVVLVIRRMENNTTISQKIVVSCVDIVSEEIDSILVYMNVVTIITDCVYLLVAIPLNLVTILSITRGEKKLWNLCNALTCCYSGANLVSTSVHILGSSSMFPGSSVYYSQFFKYLFSSIPGLEK